MIDRQNWYYKKRLGYYYPIVTGQPGGRELWVEDRQIDKQRQINIDGQIDK